MIVKLKDVCTKIGSGATPKGGATVYIDSGVSFIRSQNIYNLYFDYDGLTHITDEAAKKLAGVTIEKEDVLINITGDSVARTCIVPNDVVPARVNQHVAIIRPDRNILRPRFLNYYLASPYMQAHMLGLAVGKGASRNAMTKDMIGNFDIPCPNIEVQDRIIGILSAYDDLIENNQKQIKLLEEAAQRLYKEWFVDLRFPNYENTPVVDGVPEGWEKCLLSDVADVNKLNLPKSNEYDSIDYIDLSSVKKGHILEKTRYKIKEAPGRAKKLAIDGDIIWGMVRPNLCSYALVMHPNERDVFSTGFAVISSKKVPFSYLYCLATEESFIGYLVNCTNGAAYPAVKPIHFEEAKILKPVDEILNQFHSIAEPIYRKIEALDKMVISLAEARDRLLPKLMSGELEV